MFWLHMDLFVYVHCTISLNVLAAMSELKLEVSVISGGLMRLKQ